MSVILHIRGDLAGAIRRDLRRRHVFAHERVGFICGRVARLPQDGLLILPHTYHPVDDQDYLDDPRFGAVMGSAAIRKALEIAYLNKVTMIHVHLHDHDGAPAFSRVDLTENAKFMPDFFNVAACLPHCAVVLSADAAIGLCWRPGGESSYIDEIAEIGAPMRISRGR